jgi:hypothetical protein
MKRIIDLQTALLDLLQKVHDSEIRLVSSVADLTGSRSLLMVWNRTPHSK